MSMMNRAAQFAPFAALTGFDDAIRERRQQTDAQFEESDVEDEWTITPDYLTEITLA